jgi:adenosylcobinamide-phosphate synthase
MQPLPSAIVALAALPVEAAFGYPEALYSAIGHPVTWMGKLIDALDRRLNRPEESDEERRRQGIVATGLIVASSVAVASAFSTIVADSFLGDLLRILAATTLIAQRSLYNHVSDVAGAFETEGVEAARRAVARIVGRDTDVLDESGIARAAIESLAENFSDGVVAPAFWLFVAGLPGIAVYKAVNTADSMIGHLTPRHAAFGWAAARLDDVLNLVPARLGAFLIALSAAAAGGSFQQAWKAARRDAPKHRSPNAGWPEAAMAGALGVALGGPRRYGNEIVDGALMGNGRRQASAADIRAALKLYQAACVAQWLLLAAVWLIVRRWL